MSTFDDFMDRQAGLIDRYGWAVVSVQPAEADPAAVPFAYTVGLTEYDYPELLIAGLPPELAHPLLNDMAGRVFDRAERFTTGQHISDLLTGYDAVMIDGTATEDLHPGAAYVRYGTDRVRVQQIVWPDPQGRFPWDDDYSKDQRVQPLLARR